MSNRTYICLPCRTSRRAEAAYGLKTELRCAQCGDSLWELEWRWRIPQKNDDKGWRELEEKVARDAAEWLPRRAALGAEKLAELDRKIENVRLSRPSESRDRRLKKLIAERSTTKRKYTNLVLAPGHLSAPSSPAHQPPSR